MIIVSNRLGKRKKNFFFSRGFLLFPVQLQGEIKIPFQYETVNKFSEGFAWARRDSTWYLLRKPK